MREDAIFPGCFSDLSSRMAPDRIDHLFCRTFGFYIDFLYKILYKKSMKTIQFSGSTLDDIKAFPDKVKQRIGYQLHRIQIGEEPSDWKPMKTVGPGVRGIRIKDGDQYRVIYIASFSDEVYVLHAFQKKTQKTAA